MDSITGGGTPVAAVRRLEDDEGDNAICSCLVGTEMAIRRDEGGPHFSLLVWSCNSRQTLLAPRADTHLDAWVGEEVEIPLWCLTHAAVRRHRDHVVSTPKEKQRNRAGTPCRSAGGGEQADWRPAGHLATHPTVRQSKRHGVQPRHYLNRHPGQSLLEVGHRTTTMLIHVWIVAR